MTKKYTVKWTVTEQFEEDFELESDNEWEAHSVVIEKGDVRMPVDAIWTVDSVEEVDDD